MDHFSSLVLMRTKSSIEDFFERTAFYRTGPGPDLFGNSEN